MTEYMNMTGGLGQYAEGLRECYSLTILPESCLAKVADFKLMYFFSAVEVPSPGKPGYTLFVPRDDAFWRLFVQE